MSQNKIFHCAYFFMHFRIKFLLFNDFPPYINKMTSLHQVGISLYLTQTLNLTDIRPVGAELFREYEQTDRQT